MCVCVGANLLVMSDFRMSQYFGKAGNISRQTCDSKELKSIIESIKRLDDGQENFESTADCWLEIQLMNNASYFRTFQTVKREILNSNFVKQYSNGNKLVNNLYSNNHLVATGEHLFDDQARYLGATKTIPNVISIGLNVVLDIIKNSYKHNPQICIQSLQSLYNLLQCLKPESLKYEPAIMVEKFFDLITFLITNSYNSIVANMGDNSEYHVSVLEQSILSFITLSIARGEPAKLLQCIKTLLIDCNQTQEADCHNFRFPIPEIVFYLKKNVCSLLLRQYTIPEWSLAGFPLQSLCETFELEPKRKANSPQIHCTASITFDGENLFLLRCNRIHLIGTGYNGTSVGQELLVTTVNNGDNSRCCSPAAWIGFISGELFVQPNTSWCSNQILHLDPQSLKPKQTVPLITNYCGSEAPPFANTTLATTDGDYLILISLLNEDYYTFRELKPLKIKMDSANVASEEKVTFSLSSEFTIRLSSVCFGFCGFSSHELPTKGPDSKDLQQPSQLKLICSKNFCDMKDIVNIVTAKEFSLLLTSQGKVYFTGSYKCANYSNEKWSVISFPKSVKIVQIATGHECKNALMLSDDGLVFYVGFTPNYTELACGGPYTKPYRVRKLQTTFQLQASSIACNTISNAIISTCGELYLFGKESYYTDCRGLFNMFPKEFLVKSIAMGKGHMLILTTTGLVIIRGCTFRGRCCLPNSRIYNQEENSGRRKVYPQTNPLDYGAFKSLPSEQRIINGHLFGFGLARRCTACFKCTENGDHCTNSLNHCKILCGCSKGSNGCLFCGVCFHCAQYPYRLCPVLRNNNDSLLDELNKLIEKQSKSIQDLMDFEQLDTKFQHIQTALDEQFSRMLLTIDNEEEYNKIALTPPSVLPLKSAVKQVAAGLQHSILLTEDGEVLTFGSNQSGQLGHGDFFDRNAPTRVPVELATTGSVIQIAAGSNHTVLLTSLGEVLTFGNYQFGQLGRSCYNTCKLDYAWNSFPAKMYEIGPENGRIASWISASNNSTFVKFDEILLSANWFRKAKLMVDNGNLILIPPLLNHKKNFDELFEEQNCKHAHCKESSSSPAIGFNNLCSNILIVSRVNGLCSILDPSSSSVRWNRYQINQLDQINFNQYSAIFIDRFYSNLWCFNSYREEFSRFSLISLEASAKMEQLAEEKCHSNANWEAKFPTSLWSMHRLNASNVTQHLKIIPSVLQPDISMFHLEYYPMRHSTLQMGIELFSTLTSLTYCRLLELSVKNEECCGGAGANFLNRNHLPREYRSICRFNRIGKKWAYPPNSVEAIRFSADYDLLLGGVGVYGGRGQYSIQLRVIDIGFDGNEDDIDSMILTETDLIHYQCSPLQTFQIFFEEPLLLQANRWYSLTATFTGPCSDSGLLGNAFVHDPDSVVFQFKPSKFSNNGTDVYSGQFPELIYKIKSGDEFHKTNPPELNVELDGFPLTISKDFVFQINSNCIDYLCEILRHSWTTLNQSCEKILTGEENKANLNRATVTVRSSTYMACFALELLRAYIHIVTISFDDMDCRRRSETLTKTVQKYSFSNCDESNRISQSLYEICQLLHRILTCPVGLEKLKPWKYSSQSKLISLVEMTHFFINECHQTYLICCHLLYPTSYLRWNLICDILDEANFFSNQKLYHLSAVINAFCSPNIKLATFLPLKHGSIFETFEKNDLIPQSDIELSFHISKCYQELFHFESGFLCGKYTTGFLVDSLLQLMIDSINDSIEEIHLNKLNSTTAAANKNYQQLGNLKRNQSLYNSSSSSSSFSSFEEYLKNEDSGEDNQHDDDDLENFSFKLKNLCAGHRQSYVEKLLSGVGDFLIKLTTELTANYMGLLNSQYNTDSVAVFAMNYEYITPSRFCRRSSTKCWETGSGSSEAICFTVNKSGIFISGARVYSSTSNRFKYQLTLLDQSNNCWNTLSSVSGIHQEEGNSNNKNSDFCDLRFERPVLVKPFIKYAIQFKSYSTYSFSGDMGLGQVVGEDDTLFTFMDCLLSKNGTNLNRGQIPQILYYNIPVDVSVVEEKSPNFNNELACESLVHILQQTLDHTVKLLNTGKNFIAQYPANNGNSSNSSTSSNCSMGEIDFQILKLLYSIFDSNLFKKFIPTFAISIQPMLSQCGQCWRVLAMIQLVIGAIAELSKTLNEYFSAYDYSSLATTSTQSIVVESDHPYKQSTVSTHFVKFPPNVQSMWVDFDSKCSTAKPEDYLEIYIPSLTQKTSTEASDSNSQKSSFHNLTKIYRQFSGKNFTKNVFSEKADDWRFRFGEARKNLSSISLYVPGNELVLMWKTSTDQPNQGDQSDEDLYYGFKVTVSGFVFPFKDLHDSCSFNSLKESLFENVKQLIQYFESNIVFVAGMCINSLLNATPKTIVEELAGKRQSNTELKNLDLNIDTNLAEQIYMENIAILFKNLNLSKPLTMEMVDKFDFSIQPINSFLDDFIKLSPLSSGARLALWFQSESFILPNSSLLSVFDSLDFCCAMCAQLLDSNLTSPFMLCSTCHYQLFIKTISPNGKNDCEKVISSVKKIFIKIVTRDQHQEIAFDSNACVEANIYFLSPFTTESGDCPKSDPRQSLLSIIEENPYSHSTTDKVRYQTITMMKPYEKYSLEELRYYTQSALNRNTLVEHLQLRSFENGYYLTSWTPKYSGCYRIELVVDGECSENNYVVNISDLSPSEPTVVETTTTKKIVEEANKFVDRTFESKPKTKHCIRKFACQDSAGLRIRALPSLQSEQIGIVATNGLLTIIDQYENDDGTWVRLSNESIQVYCSNSTGELYPPASKDFFDNFEMNLNELNFVPNKSSLVCTFQTEAWALQFNRHFNRTLLVSIDSEDDVDRRGHSGGPSLPWESVVTPSWFQVVNCGQNGHLIRNGPSLDECSTIIGIVSLNEMVNAVEAIQNEFGVWIRLSQDSLHSHITTLYKSTFIESNIEGWMLVQSLNGLIYLQNVAAKVDTKDPKYLDSCSLNNNNKYSVDNEDNYMIVAKHAISNNTAQCIRAIFAAFVWHEGILHDVFTAASYLKFNAEITKELVKCFNEKPPPEQENRNRKRANRNPKAAFRHSVEVSQLLTMWSSDVNSNISDLFSMPVVENNNNEIANNNNHPEGNLERKENSPEDNLVMIPELLINLLKIWEFVSSECSKLFGNFTHVNLENNLPPVEMDSSFTSPIKSNDNDGIFARPRLQRKRAIYRKTPLRQYHSSVVEDFKPQDTAKSEEYVDTVSRKHISIGNIQQFYEALKNGAYYLLSLVPAIDPSLSENCPATLAQLALEHFQVDDPYNFRSLQQLGIQKSIYERKLAEENLSKLAILSIQNGEDFQNLLSPDYLKNWQENNNVDPLETSRKSFKFYRSISVGLNDSAAEYKTKNKPYSLQNRGINKSSENLDLDSGKSYNMPFLCKPSTRLLSLIQNYTDTPKEKDLFIHSTVVSTFHSTLFNLDIFRFIFSCYNLEMYRVISKCSLTAAAYRTVALNALDWLVTNVSCPTSLHDLMWMLVFSLLPDQSPGKEEEPEASHRKQPIMDVCEHPFKKVSIAGNSAEIWISNALHRLIKSISNLLPLLPMGSPLQQMAIRCFAIDFQPNDHKFLHECKLFSHISTILARSSAEDLEEQHSDSENELCTDYLWYDVGRDVSLKFELLCSTHQPMAGSLVDNSTETFWESGLQDSRSEKHIFVKKAKEQPDWIQHERLKFILIYVDNVRDSNYKIESISFQLCREFKDQQMDTIADCDREMIQEVKVEEKFFGWIQCELSSSQCDQIIAGNKCVDIELKGSQYIRIRQICLLSLSNYFDQFTINQFTSMDNHQYPKLIVSNSSNQIQSNNCEAETWKVFRLLTSQVFGKLLSNEPQSSKENRLSFYQNNDNFNNENDLKQHMVGILFSHCGRLSELQLQVCSHFVREIHSESSKTFEEWESSLLSGGEIEDERKEINDSYCFEILSLVLALSGSDVGCRYLSKQNELLYDVLTLLHTSSDRVKRQVMAILRRILSGVKPAVFGELFQISSTTATTSLNTGEESESILEHVAVLDIFLSVIGKSLSVQTKIKGLGSAAQAVKMCQVFRTNELDQWWLMGSSSKQISHSIITIIKEMIGGKFGAEWSFVARECIKVKILNMTHLPGNFRSPKQCLHTPTLWLALASLCVLSENDAQQLFSTNLSMIHDQANGNSVYCDNHDDGKTIAFIHCDICGNLCTDCDRFLHLSAKTRSHKRNMVKEKADLIKIDIYESCGRAKFFWCLAVADSKLLKTLVEFRNEEIEQKEASQSGDFPQVCRFCGTTDCITGSAVGVVCYGEQCQRFAGEICPETLRCGHRCMGITGEHVCLPCLHGCTNDIKQDGDDMCIICFTESLFSAPCIQLECNHVFHYHCVKTVLEKRWSGARISFTFSQCPICKVSIEHRSLEDSLKPIKNLFEDVKKKALMRLEYEGLYKCEAITTPGNRFYNDPTGYAIDKYSYYLCFKCGKAYYGGEARCEANYDNENFNPQELICGRCSDVAQAQICPKHGTDYLEYKCRYCCSVAVYFCFGTTHFCGPCHEDFQRLVLVKQHTKCPVGPQGIPLEGEECPLRVVHPPTGQEFALGCGICRNAYTF